MKGNLGAAMLLGSVPALVLATYLLADPRGGDPPVISMQSPVIAIGGASPGVGPALVTVGQTAVGTVSNEHYSAQVGAVAVFVATSELPPCEGDANGDGVVDPLDSGYVLSRFGCSVATGDLDCDAADLNSDGIVDPLDSGYALARFGTCE